MTELLDERVRLTRGEPTHIPGRSLLLWHANKGLVDHGVDGVFAAFEDYSFNKLN